MTADEAVTSRVADFAAGVSLARVPEDVASGAQALVRVGVRAGTRAAATDPARLLHAFLAQLDEPEKQRGNLAAPAAGYARASLTAASAAAGPVLGIGGPLSPSAAVTFNAACMSPGFPGSERAGAPGAVALPGACQPAAVVAAVFGAAQMPGVTGRSLLEGVVVGSELGVRVTRALECGGLAAGWSAVTVASRIAAAVAVVKSLRGGAAEFSEAIGLAATQSGGLYSAVPAVAAGLLAGRAACDGWEAGLLARTGWNGPHRPLEGDRGLFRLMTGHAAGARRIITDLGDEWVFPRAIAPDATNEDIASEALAQQHRDPAPRAVSAFMRLIESAGAEISNTGASDTESVP